MIITQSTLDVNAYQLREVRMSFIQCMPELALLQSRNPPAIPAAYLLDDVGFTKQYANAAKRIPPLRLPWFNGDGKLFWNRYVPTRSISDLRRALIPIEYDLASIVTSLSLADGSAVARAFLYPWGVSILVDVTVKRSAPLNQAVARLMEIRNRSQITWKMGADSGAASPAALAAEIRKRLAPLLYGAQAQMQAPADPFSIVTVVDADDLVVTDAIPANGPIHYALEGLTGWNRLWASVPPPPDSLTKCRVPSKSAPVGHILYGKDRNRAVWFPADFRSVADYPETLSCFHQNLTAASLHAESLCVLAQDASARLASHGSVADYSATYRNCAQLAAGILGRLHGRKPDDADSPKLPIYRSGSVRAQILQYKDAVNQLRLSYPSMGALGAKAQA